MEQKLSLNISTGKTKLWPGSTATRWSGPKGEKGPRGAQPRVPLGRTGSGPAAASQASGRRRCHTRPGRSVCRVGRGERVRLSWWSVRDGSRSGPASPQGGGKGARHLLGSQSGDFVLGTRAASKRECGKRWGIDAIRAENPRGAPTCARLPTAGPEPPAHDPVPAPRHPSPRTRMPLRTYTHCTHTAHVRKQAPAHAKLTPGMKWIP